MNEFLQARIQSPGPKRILSLDGGGIRGLITIGYLERVEKVLRDNLANLQLYKTPASPEAFRLRDYYDLIGGTSTGSIIAAGLAVGLSVAELRDHYLKLSHQIFARPTWLGGLTQGGLASKFRTGPLKKVLGSILGDRLLGDDSITTGLAIIAKKTQTNSMWVLTNAPDNLFYADVHEPNSALKLSQVVRASTAAPTYFDPEPIVINKAQHNFIDGGVSAHNNPALQLLLAATLPNFGFSWPVGADKLSLLSIGTGEWRRGVEGKRWRVGSIPAKHLIDIISMFMEDCSKVNETILQVIGAGHNRRNIDALTGRLTGTEWGQSLLRYERFQIMLELPFFKENGLDQFIARIPEYRKMDSVKYVQDLLQMGRILAERDIHDHVIP